MFSVFEKLIDKFSPRLDFLSRIGSPSFKLKQANKNGDNVAGDKNIYIQSHAASSLAEVGYAWAGSEVQEDDQTITYEFELRLLNKSEQIIKDLWINFSSSGFNLEIEMTPHTSLFDGWNVHNEALNLVAKQEYRFAPQNLLHPFKVRITLKKHSVPNHDAWIYFSFGAPNVKKIELEGKITYQRLLEFISSSDHSLGAFLRALGLVRNG